MKVFSNNKNTWLRIERKNTDGHDCFEVEVSVDLGHGRFHAQNDDLFWLNMDEFVTELDAFVLDRTVVPRLNGTYDSFLGVSAQSNSVTVEFAIGDAYCSSKTHNYLFEGSFELDQESLLSLVRDFQAHSSDDRS